MEEVRKACERALPFSFEFKLGHFIKRRINLEDERVLGLKFHSNIESSSGSIVQSIALKNASI